MRQLAALLCCAVLLVSGLPSQAMFLRVFNATAHKRFINFPSATEINTSHIFSTLDLTGIGFRSSLYPPTQCTLVSRQHVIFATHNRDKLVGATVTFLNSANQVVTRTCGTMSVIYKNGSPTDLVLFQLNAPIDSDAGIAPLPYYSSTLTLGTNLGVTGRDDTAAASVDKVPLVGKADVDEVGIDLGIGATYGGQEIQTRLYRYDYIASPPPPQSDPNHCYLGASDSGNPTFVPVGSTAALVGVHTARDATTYAPDVINLDTHVSYYVTELDAVLNPLGYRMRPHSIPATTLSGSGTFTTATPRKAMALDYEYDIGNTGTEVAGNVEVQLQFASGEGPDSVSATGWVTYGSGDKWTLRRSTLAAAASNTLNISWTAAPSVDNLAFSVTRRSDASAETVDNENVALADSYADWASALTLTGLADDEDGDGISNLKEYALGGDPQGNSLLFDDGGPLLPLLEQGPGTVTFSHPERTDKAARGLSYDIEFSTILSGWTTTTPPGFSTTTVAYDPDVPGFVQRRWTWTQDSTDRFARVKITLTE